MHQFNRVAAVVAAAAFTFTMPAAKADTDSRVDSTGDVWSISYDAASLGGSEPVLSTESVNVDLTETVVTHGSKAIRVVATFVDLKKTGDGYGFVLKTRDNKGRKAGLSVMVEEPRWRGVSLLMTKDGYDCKGFRHTIDYAANTVTMRAPRKCLDRPRWVEYKARSGAWTYGNDDSETVFMDDARSDQAMPKGWSGRIRRD